MVLKEYQGKIFSFHRVLDLKSQCQSMGLYFPTSVNGSSEAASLIKSKFFGSLMFILKFFRKI